MKKLALGALALSLLAGCGSSPTEPPPPPPPPPTPAANITATGGGNLVVHPSIDPTYAVALEAPIRIIESAGGSADWNYARLALFLRGSEIERAEIGAGTIEAAGYTRIGVNSNQVYRTIFRFNSDDFDRFDVTLGFTDRKDGRTFTVAVPAQSFPDVALSFTPMSRPRSSIPR
jgi:hypothetical protein